jgi:hypothetical protein
MEQIMKSNAKIVLTALVSVLLVGAGVGIVGLHAQPSTLGTPTTIGSSAQELPSQTNPDSSKKSMISTNELNWIEVRLSNDREFIKSVFGVVATIVGVLIVTMGGALVFFGYKTWLSIKVQINKAVNEKIEEKSNEFLRIYQQKIEGLEDQAAVASYSIQFLVPQNDVFEIKRTIILPIHLRRFVDILADKNADKKLLAQIYHLLSDVSHDGNSQSVNETLFEMVSCAETFSWIGNDATRLSKIIDLLRDRDVKADPARVRAFLKDETTPPDVRKSAILYAERVRDADAVEYLKTFLSDKRRLADADETIFAFVSLSPKHKWVTAWIADLAKQPRDSNNLAQAARVAGYLMQSLERRMEERDIKNYEKEEALDFAATVSSLIIDHGVQVYIVKRPDNKELVIRLWFPDQSYGLFEVKGNLFLWHAGAAVVNKLCHELIVKQDIVGITKFVKSITPEFVYYYLEAQLGHSSEISVDVDGAPCIIAHYKVRFGLRSSQGQEFLLASWQTDEGVPKTGVVKRINGLKDVRFSFNIPGISNIIDDGI